MNTFIYIITVAAVFFGAWFIQAHFESAAYERVTGKKVSTWDAMWLELRVVP